jgi:hypothetical protein
METLEQLIARIEAAGFDWAVGRESGKFNAAACEKAPASYIGDYLAGPGGENGDTPYEALFNAFTNATK